MIYLKKTSPPEGFCIMKYDKDKVEAKLNQEYFARKVDLVPVSLRETYSDLVSKNPVLVSRELMVDGRPLIGIEYTTDGEIANVYTTDAKGKRVNFENTAEQSTSNTAPDLISERLAAVKDTITHETAQVKKEAPAPEKKTVTPRKLDQRLKDTLVQSNHTK